MILQQIKIERGQKFSPEIDDLSRVNLGCTLVATFGTETTKSAILTACRGYRSEDCPDGIDTDTAKYLSSLIPQERGFIWSLSDVVYGNPEKDRKPVTIFLNEVQQYPGLLEIMQSIENLKNKRSSHASGVILFDEDPYEFGCFMRTPSGEVITQYDLHDCEYAGMVKYDFLVTDVSDKLTECIKLLQEYGEIESSLTLREIYNKYFHPNVLPIDDQEIWKALHNDEVINCFQFDSEVGSQAAKKIRPTSILEMADSNGLMRLMTSEKGEETPMEKYIRFKEDISLWYKEMDNWGLTKAEQKILEPYFKSSYGVPPSQEQLMRMLMDKDICGFTLAEANGARKIVGKKQMSKIPELQEKVLKQAKSKQLGEYIWKFGAGPQMGYSFSVIHALAYSFIGFQTLMIAKKWNPIYWNTACLIVNSGSLEENSDWDSDEETAGKKQSTDYAKMAKALGDIIAQRVKISLVDINKSAFGFKPDIENNQILFGLNALGGVNEAIIEKIIAGRPYSSIADFMDRCDLNKTAMISLIKAGAFDNLEKDFAEEIGVNPRYAAMAYYISKESEPKSKLTLQNFNGLIQKNLIPQNLYHQKEVFNFNKYLKAVKIKDYYVLDDKALNFYNEYYNQEYVEVINGQPAIRQKVWDIIYDKEMDAARAWLKENQKELLKEYNFILCKEMWDKYAKGSISAWEMEALCFYYNEHELAHINFDKYGIADFFELSPNSEVDYFFKRKGKEIPIFKTYKLVGTVISKNDTRASIALLTPTGVVNVKFTKEYYAMFKRQISEKQEDGKKKVMEQGWFKRGTKLLVTGYRRDDTFVAKSYKHTTTHQIYKITNIDNKGNIEITHDRYETKGENDE